MKWQQLEVLQTENLQEFHASIPILKKHFTKKSLVLLKAPMGGGKTEWVKTFGMGLGFEDVSSPTFAIHHRYKNAGSEIDHLDLFRIKNEDDLESTGFWDLLSASEGLIFIEWSERMNLENLPLDWDVFEISISIKGENARRLDMRRRL